MVECGQLSKRKTGDLVCAVSVPAPQVRIKYTYMHKLQNANCVILLLSEMSLCLHLKLALHKVKVNGKSHASH